MPLCLDFVLYLVKFLSTDGIRQAALSSGNCGGGSVTQCKCSLNVCSSGALAALSGALKSLTLIVKMGNKEGISVLLCILDLLFSSSRGGEEEM